MTHTLFSAEFKQACRGSGCPFCTLTQDNVERYVRNLVYEYTLAPDIHLRMADARGFCNTHAWLLQRVEWAWEKDGMGTAILYGSVVERLRNDLAACLEHNGGARGPGKASSCAAFAVAVLRQLQPKADCLVCEHQAHMEQFAARNMVEHLSEAGIDSDLAQLYRGSAGACLPHFLMLLEQSPPNGVARWLTEAQQEKAALLRAELDEYVRKHDVRYKQEPKGAEQDSWLRAIEQMAGRREIPRCYPHKEGARK